MTTLTTRRTILTPFAPSDADELLDVFRDPGVRKYLLDDELVPRSWVEDEIAASERRRAESGACLWCVREAQHPRIIGFVGFREFFEPPELQLLYGLLPAFWGRGLATEVAHRLCRHGFAELGFHEIRAAIDAPHTASRRVLERLGFHETGTQPDETGDDGGGTTFFVLHRGKLGAGAAERRGTGGAEQPDREG